jgi:hypothetical protein
MCDYIKFCIVIAFGHICVGMEKSEGRDCNKYHRSNIKEITMNAY